MHLRPDLAALAASLDGPPVTRFAPTPTGLLHLGHVVNAIYVWGVAGALGGRVIFRLEDHDRRRSRPEYEAALVEDLEWLGFVTRDDARRMVRQSDTPERYAHALTGLAGTAHVYACACSRKDVDGERYPGTCRSRGLDDGNGRGLRVQLNPGSERFSDALIGTCEQVPADQCGDLLIRDRDGDWTYQFAVVVDDLSQGVSLIIRGHDLLPSTGRQLALGRMLGRPHPGVFLHHPLVLGPDGRKLSKSAGDTGVRSLRQAGFSPDAVVGMAAAAIGLMRRPRPMPAGEVAALLLGSAP